MHPPIDPMARFGAIIMMALVVGLLLISAYDQRAARTVEAREPALAATPRLVQVIATPTAAPTLVPAPIATPVPTPVPEVIYVVQYIKVPATVPIEAPAIVHEQNVAVPVGAVQVMVSSNGAPVVSSVHMDGVEMERPRRLDGETAKQVTP